MQINTTTTRIREKGKLEENLKNKNKILDFDGHK